ncbi:serpin A12-like [Anomaloglossus baeobatrachus]|uniref:serpin A12-like n=1 Tax=Anomaloglossus baeobatrachus TaxID=238106 RepID=UPI003F4FF7AF
MMKALLFLCLGASFVHLGVLQNLYLTVKAPRHLPQQNPLDFVFFSLEFNIASLNAIADDEDGPGSSFQPTDGVDVFLNSATNEEENVATVAFNNPAEARTKLNNFVTEKTSGKINNFFSGFKTTTDSVIVSYVDAWKLPVSEGKKYIVQLKGTYNALINTEVGFTMIEIPKNQYVNALIIIPDNGKEEKVGKAVTDANLAQWRKSLSRQMVNLEVPRATLYACAAVTTELYSINGFDYNTNKVAARISATFP